MAKSLDATVEPCAKNWKVNQRKPQGKEKRNAQLKIKSSQGFAGEARTNKG